MRKFYILLFMIISISMVSSTMASVAGDADGDGKVGLTDAINALQVTAGVSTSASSSVNAWKIVKIIEVENDESVETDEITCFIYKEGCLSKKVQYNRNRSSGNLYGEQITDFITDANDRIIYDRGYEDYQITTTRYEYDVNGRLVGLYEDSEDDGTDDEHAIFTYNSENQITRIDSSEDPEPNGGYTLLFYNEDGQVNSWEDYTNNDQLKERGVFTYEADGRLSQENWYDSNDNLLGTSYFTCKQILSPANAFNDYIYQLIIW